MPFDEPIDPKSHRDWGALDSAVHRPFQTFDGADLHPTTYHKAAALFHSLACNHCFLNGNKRTAVMAVDMFLTANEVILLMANRDVYELAKETVEANERGEALDAVLEGLVNRFSEESAPFDVFLEFVSTPEFARHRPVYERYKRDCDSIRSHPLNA